MALSPSRSSRWAVSGLARHVADLAHHAPIDGEGGKSACSAVIGQRIQERVAGDVVRLPRIADDGGDRREQHEEIQRNIERQRVEIPGAHDLGRHGLPHPLLGQAFDRRIVQHHCGVHDAAQRSHLALNGSDDLRGSARRSVMSAGKILTSTPLAAGPPPRPAPMARVRCGRPAPGDARRAVPSRRRPPIRNLRDRR